MAQPGDALVRLVRDWRATLPPPRLQGPRDEDERLAVTPARDAAHCAALSMRFLSSTSSLEASATRLGEVLRVAALAASRHVDVAVWNALWHEDELCPKAPYEECKRCDAMEPDVPVEIDLDIRGERERWTSEAVLYGALFEWDEREATDAYKALARALQAPNDSPAPVCPQVHLQHRVVDAVWSADLPAVARDLTQLLSRASQTPSIPGVRITALSVRLPSHEAVEPVGRDILATVFDSGLPAALRHHGMWSYRPEMWTSLLEAPAPCVSHVNLQSFRDHDGWIAKLLRFLTRPHPHLRELHFYWHLEYARAYDEYRKHAAEAIGTALFSTHSSLRLEELTINIGDILEEDIAAIESGAGEVDRTTTTRRFERVRWCMQETPETHVVRIVRLFGTVGVRQLHVDAWKRPVSCGALKAILQHCRQCAKLTLWGLTCEAFGELGEAEWPRYDGELSDLELRVSGEGGNDSTVHAMTALLRRVGAQLTRLAIATAATANDEPNSEHAALFSVEVAQVIVECCPNLDELDVSGADPQFYERLLHAFDSNQWGLKALTVRTCRGDVEGPVGVVTDALRDQGRVVAHQLRTLRMTTCFHDAFDSLLESLASCTRLQRVELLGRLNKGVIAKLRALPRQHSSRAPSIRRQLALLSVMTRLPPLDRDVLCSIFEFAGRRTRRYALITS